MKPSKAEAQLNVVSGKQSRGGVGSKRNSNQPNTNMNRNFNHAVDHLQLFDSQKESDMSGMVNLTD